MMAGEGLIADAGLVINPNLDTSLYTSQPIVVDFKTTIAAFEGDLFEPAEEDPFNPGETLFGTGNPSGISPSLAEQFVHSMDDTLPFLTNVNPAATNVSTRYYDAFLANHLTNIFPSSGRYVQYLQIAMGQKDTANQYINSAVNGANLSKQTFTTMDALMTGNLTAVSRDVNTWGLDLLKTGSLFDFAKIDNIGTPQSLVEALMRTNMLSTIADELEAQGVDVFDIKKAINNEPDITLQPTAQKRCYDAFTQVTGEQLEEILFVLGVETIGITALSDLLDLTKVFPNSFFTITSPNHGTPENIYITPEGEIALWVLKLNTPATVYMPGDLARTNYVFTIALGQIKGIINSTPENIGTQASTIEGNDGLSATGSLAEALPAATTAFFKSSMGGGTGPDTTFYLTDLAGSPAGIPHVNNITTMNDVIEQFQNNGDLDDIAEIFLVMRNVIAGVYTVQDDPPMDPPEEYDATFSIVIPNPLPAEGTHRNKNAALSALMRELTTASEDLIAAYPTETENATAAFTGSVNGIIIELEQLWDAELKFQTTYLPEFETNDPLQNGMPRNKKTILGFAENLHSHGKKTSKGDIVEILEAMATDTQSGNAIIAAMREGRNLSKLSEAGVSSDNLIDDQNSVIEPGNIS